MPPFLAQRYVPHAITVADSPMLAVRLVGDELPPTRLHKQVHHLLQVLAVNEDSFCLVAEQLSPYLRRRLVEMRLPFVIPGRQVFWPGLGYAESIQRPRRLQLSPVDRLGPAAQQLLLAMLLRRLPKPISVSESGQMLGYAAMSMSRAVKALEGAGLITSAEQGRRRTFSLADAPEIVWQRALPKLHNPVTRAVHVLRRDLPKLVTTRAGESALAQLSDLAPAQQPVFAMASRVWSRLQPQVSVVPTVDKGTCCVELWRYAPEPTSVDGCVDPLSLYLSLRNQADERVQMALDQLLERVRW